MSDLGKMALETDCKPEILLQDLGGMRTRGALEWNLRTSYSSLVYHCNAPECDTEWEGKDKGKRERSWAS